ncbi:glycoside hydrolase family 88/105 protein [Lacticaseibacillus jixiensis]|uniref:glycoside hydrolase family 88/105 protein n=1 Tax=Lacticaseibacillus jixiensis TaxID=3231926 RepID=UPI0036F23603
MQKNSEIALKTLLERWPLLPKLPFYQGKWSYDIGVVLQGVKLAYEQTGTLQYRDYVQQTMDCYVNADGSINGYDPAKHNSDFINNGKLLLFLYEQTGAEQYRLAADRLYAQIQTMPRTSAGGFWHKQVYTQQMWLDGLYMVEPFYADYILRFKPLEELDDVVRQFELIYLHTKRPDGLLAHAYDAVKQQPWADPTTGQSPHAWGRAMGWYAMALVDCIELMQPQAPADAQRLIKLFTQVYAAIQKVQDPATGVWYQVLDAGAKRGNYLEASASAMFVYAAAKALRLGVLPATEYAWVQAAYAGLCEQFVFYTKEGWLNLIRNCQVAGLGGSDQRDGSFVYYISEPIIANDFKGYGAFLQAALEVEALDEQA